MSKAVNGEQVTVAAPLSIREKERVEKLIIGRAEQLTNHLSEIEGYVLEMQQHQPFSKAQELADAQLELAATDEEAKKLARELEEKTEAVVVVLQDEFNAKKARLDALLKKLERDYEQLKRAARESVRQEHNEALLALTSRKTTLEKTVKGLQHEEKQETALRKIAVRQGFSNLKNEITDRRNRGAETLWTDACTTPKEVLEMVPEASALRARITPQAISSIFNDTLRLQHIPTEKLVCEACGKSQMEPNALGIMQCAYCGKAQPASENVLSGVQLPSLEQISQ